MKKIAATVLILNGDKVLGVSRKNDPTMMGLPGGKCDPGETPLEAAIRELKEETGIEAKAEELTPFYEALDATGWHTVTYLLAERETLVGWTKEDLDEHETGAVDWCTWEQMTGGPFKDYNTAVWNLAVEKNLTK